MYIRMYVHVHILMIERFKRHIATCMYVLCVHVYHEVMNLMLCTAI